MSRIPAPAKKFLPVIYWLFFAILCAIGATDPGYIPRSMPLPPYPVLGVAIAWAILGMLIWWRGNLFISPATTGALLQPVQRVAYVVILLLLFSPVLSTDQSGLTWAMALFSFLELVLLIARGLSLASIALFRRLQKTP